ncbi:uncharacterized protein BDZ99DRAFT_76744 [Mytilinidion resinicola]|uniref:Uncharacterized protein n=1 Tax=Mytilinidion resinicola TaxID=574789 RepID=A0A6A6YEJ5_9PEZI|nr:uncharacterized protein BDZ99DRAFT_76744 [Mytilinidion resinicola]KAF2807242.1 hypothetical protein BDZ99DRAFT_76744 [Mytilinidion resinicola]
MFSPLDAPPQANRDDHAALPRAGILTYLISPPPPYVPRSPAEQPWYPADMPNYSTVETTSRESGSLDMKRVRFAVEEDDELDGMLEDGDIVTCERDNTGIARCRRHESGRGGWLGSCTMGEKVMYLVLILSAVMNAVAIFGPWSGASGLREVKFCLAEQRETYPETQLWRIVPSEEDAWKCEESITLLALADEYGEVDMEYQGVVPMNGWVDNQ